MREIKKAFKQMLSNYYNASHGTREKGQEWANEEYNKQNKGPWSIMISGLWNVNKALYMPFQLRIYYSPTTSQAFPGPLNRISIIFNVFLRNFSQQSPQGGCLIIESQKVCPKWCKFNYFQTMSILSYIAVTTNGINIL